MLESGYIKLHRSLLQWEWYQDINTKVLFIHLLLTVNYEPKKWRGIDVQRGQRVVSYTILAQELRLSTQNIRTALKHLISTGEVTYHTTAEYGLVTVNNYEKYQSLTDQTTDDQQSANSQVTDDQQSANNKGIKLIKNKKAKKETPPISPTRDMEEAFKKFWSAYPKKACKQDAEESFYKVNPNNELLDQIIKAIQRQAKVYSWTKGREQYIPNASTWLNQKRWLDDADGNSQEEYKWIN